MIAVRLIVSGRVQGVWYRGWTVREARARGLNGWVRNRRDGTVEMVLAGPPGRVDDMILACRGGPPMAQVVDIARHPAEMPADAGFDQRPTV